MSAEARQWLTYVKDNRQVASLSRDSGLFNPSLQNAQQHVIPAGGLALEDTRPVCHKHERHPCGCLEGVAWRGRRDSNPRPPA